MIVIVDYFVKRRSFAVGIVTSATAMGILVMTQVTQALLHTFGWQGALKGFAVLYFICGLCAIVFIPLDHLKQDDKGNTPANKKVHKENESSSLFRNRSFLVILSSFMVVNLSYFVPTVHIVSMELY